MRNSILVLEESSMVHELFRSALPSDFREWRIDHESKPDRYVKKARESQPTIILLSNQDQNNNYEIAKKIRSYPDLDDIPILLLTSAKDRLDEKKLRQIGIQGFIRKPFESTTLQKQIKAAVKNFREENYNSELDDFNVVDDELLGLVSGKTRRDIAMDNLEEELDPTLQLHPIEAGSILEEDAEEDEEDEEEIEDYQPSEFIEDGLSVFDADEIDDDIEEDLDFDDGDTDDLNEEITLLPEDDAETEAIEMELEEISLDLDEIDEDEPEELIDMPSETGAYKIEVIRSSVPAPPFITRNTSDPDFIGYMDVKVLPYVDNDNLMEAPELDEFDSADIDLTSYEPDPDDDIESEKYSDFEPDDELGYTELDISFDSAGSPEIPPGQIRSNTDDTDDVGFTELEVSLEDDDIIEIEHSAITDDIAGIDEPDLVEDIDESELTEILVEGIDDIGNEEGLDEVPSFDATIDSSIDEDIDYEYLEVDFEAGEGEDAELSMDATDYDKDEEITSSADDDIEEDEFDLDDLDAIGADGPLDIQEMINLRQVRKAKYEIPVSENSDAEFDDEGDIEEDWSLEDDDDIEIDEPEDFLESAEAEASDDIFDDDSDLAEIDAPELELEDSDDEMEVFDDSDIELSPVEEDSMFEEDPADFDEPEDISIFETDDSSDDEDLLLMTDEEEESEGTDELLIDDYSEMEPLGDFDTDEVTLEGLEEEDTLEKSTEEDLFASESDVDDDIESMEEFDLDASELELSPLENLPDDEDSFETAEDDMGDTSISDTFEDDTILDDQESDGSDLMMDEEDISVEDDFYELEDGDEDQDQENASDPFEDSLEEPSDETGETDEDLPEIMDEDPFSEAEEDISMEDSFSDPTEEKEIDLLTDELPDIDDDDIVNVFDDESEESGFETSDYSETEIEPDDESTDMLLDDEAIEDANDIDLLSEVDTVEEDFDSESDDFDLPDDPFSDPDDIIDGEPEADEIEEDIFSEESDDPILDESEDTLSDDFEMDDDITDEIEIAEGDDDIFSSESFEAEDLAESDDLAMDDDFTDEPEGSDIEDGMFSEDIDETESASESGDISIDDFSMDDDITIEVPSDVFEIGDFKMESVTNEEFSDEIDENELTEDVSLPSMDEDLPDLPSISDESIEEIEDDDDLLSDPFDDEGQLEEIVALEDDDALTSSNANSNEKDKRALLSHSTELREKLSAMIEGMLSETIQSTLHDMLPEMMEKIIHEELD